MVPLLFVLLAGPVDGLGAQFARAAQPARGRVGVAALLLETGERASYNARQPFPMQSTYKAPIAMAVLQQVDAGTLRLADVVHVPKSEMPPEGVHSPLRDAHPDGFDMSLDELVRMTLVESDGTASDVLLRLAGGPAAVNAMLGRLRVQGMVVATTEAAMAAGPLVQYRNSTTPEAALSLLQAIQEGRGLSPASHALLLQRLTECNTGPHRLKGLLPEGTVVAHKTGTSNTAGGLTRATNDMGIVTLPDGRHLAIAVFVRDARADEATREAVIAHIARAAWDHWTGALAPTAGR